MTTFFIFILVSPNGFAVKMKTPVNQVKGVTANVQTKHTISTGGGMMSGSNYTVISSIGQIDAGHITNGGGHQFIGGILAKPRNNQLFKDGFE